MSTNEKIVEIIADRLADLADSKDSWGADAESVIEALADAGLVVVPREPTPELCFKVLASLPSDWDGFQAEDIKQLWRAMVWSATEGSK
jgi:hypothetical protein